MVYELSFGERVKELRNARGITQEKLAADLDIPESTIRRLETSEGLPRKERIEMIASYFNVSIDYLMGRDVKEVVYKTSKSKNETILKEIVEKYNVDLTMPGTKEKLEQIIQLVLDDRQKKK